MATSLRVGDATVNLRGPSRGDGAPARFEPSQRINTSAKEASDAVTLPDGRIAIVGDLSDKLKLIDLRGRETVIDLPKLKNGKSQLEGIAYDPVRKHLFVSREESRVLLRYEWDPATNEKPKFQKGYDVSKSFAGKERNKGVEGLAFLSAAFSPTCKAQLLIASEGNPKQLAMLDDGGGGKPTMITLEDQVKSACRDFSAVAVDPKSGNVFISSDESSVVVQLKLVRNGDKFTARLVSSIPLRDDKNKPLARVEGLTFNAKGDLYVLTENDGRLHELKRK